LSPEKRVIIGTLQPGLPDPVYFRTKNHNLSKFWRTLDWKMLIYFMVIWDILWSFGIF
jgi:hypothetical protein